MARSIKVAGWIGLGLGPLITVGSLIFDLYQIMSLGLSTGAWVIIGLSIFFAAAISLFVGYETDEKHGQLSTDKSPSPSGAEFFGTVYEMERKYPIADSYKPGNDIHALYLSGEGVFSRNKHYMRSVKRLILPRNDAPEITAIQIGSGDTGIYYNFSSQIENTTKLAQKNNIDVRWFQNFVGAGLTFCNPENLNGSLRLSLCLPCLESDKQPGLYLERKNNEELFGSLYKAFNGIWELSNAPKIQEATKP